ncbi:hypothetical protein N0V82_001467 [Gnomoniopsis sp. IMI 355080]|nr:hypothetical protein N0V82_001467 [Gnomoniopsis sp. IMI 355080]
MAEPSRKASAAVIVDDSEDVLHTARQLSRYKQRSRQTSRNDHLPMIDRVSRTPRVMLLGDSMLERMTTTGQSPSLQPWPSEQMFSRMQLAQMNSSRGLAGRSILQRVSAVFNAGCGGDKIENILYRLLGDEEPSRDEESSKEGHQQSSHLDGLVDTLSKRQTKVKLWIIHAGTNNLHKVNGLSDASLLAMQAVLKVLLSISAPETHILVTALFYRKDIQTELVDQANTKLQDLVEELALQTPSEPTSPYDVEKRRDSVISQTVSARSGNSLYDVPKPTDTGGDGTSGETSDSDPTTATIRPISSREFKAREDAERSVLEAGISRRDFQPEWKGAPKQLDHFDERRKRNKYINLQIPHNPEVPRLSFLSMPTEFDPDQHLDDHVHLNLRGYQMWMETLFPMAANMLSRADDMHYAIEQANDRKEFGEFTKLSKYGTENRNQKLAETGRFA